MRAKDVESAVEIFKINITEHPDSWNAYDSLGEAYMTYGEIKLAIEHYNKSIELNPNNDNARKMVEKLKAKKKNSESIELQMHIPDKSIEEIFNFSI